MDGLEYTWIIQVCKICAFFHYKKATKRPKIYISRRSRYAKEPPGTKNIQEFSKWLEISWMIPNLYLT